VLCEQHAFRCQLIQVRRFDFLLSVTAKLPITEIISVDINNIWPVRTKWNTALKDAYTGQNRRYSVDFIHKWLFFAGESNLIN
jgi:hypothetical protein